MRRVTMALFGFWWALAFPAEAQLVSHTQVVKLMGSRFEITAVAAEDSLCWSAIRAGVAEIQRIENLISSWDPQSQTSSINRAAGIKAVVVDTELLSLIVRANKVSKLTGGAFDISYAAIDRLWKFDGSMKQMPAPESVKSSISLINYQDIKVDTLRRTVFLQKKGMKIGFGAIGKGYAANQAKEVMQQLGIEHGLVNAGGDLLAWGQRPNGKPWSIGIVNPNDKEKIYSWLSINNQSVVTSGDYERFAVIEGVRYAHIIDPRSGYPVTGIRSVTIISPNAELSDALATAVFVLGEEVGLDLVNKLRGVECLIVTDENHMISSNNLSLNYYKE